MLTPLVKPRITGVILFAMGIILICFGIFLHFVIPVILENINVLNDNQQHLMAILSGTLGSILTGGLVALGITNIIIAVGLIKRKRWAWKALLVLTVACVSLNILIVIGIPNYTSTAMIIAGAIVDAAILFYVYKKYNKISLSFNESTKIIDKH
jgi:nitrate reductase gamma subunit